MIVHRLLDVFFRALDAVDLVRDRVDRALGRESRPDPWSVAWPANPADADRRGNGHADDSSTIDDVQAQERAERAERRARDADEAPAAARAPSKPAAPKKKKPSSSSSSKGAAKRDVPADAPKTKPGSKKPQAASRKGSVDRSGKDFDSPRARAIHEQLKAQGGRVVAEEAAVDGKKVLARVLWALRAAEGAGSELGLTAADASALLHLAAGMEVYSTNLARACRDETALIEESTPDGRSKRYKLTAAGRARADGLPTRPA